MSFNPQDSYVFLNPDGTAVSVPGGDAFWRRLEQGIAGTAGGWLVSEYLLERDWANWEMHPDGDEFVYLLSGTAQLHIEQPGVIHIVNLADSGAAIVPRGAWHTVKIKSPSRMLHITRDTGTLSRPA